MSNRIDRILQQWYPLRDTQAWVLATIVNTERSVYRKAGAMMLINEHGNTLGLLSGGCLEGDLKRLAQRVLTEEKSQRAFYDFDPYGLNNDEPWQKGLGCGGAVEIQLQAINAANAYLGFADIHRLLCEGKAVEYHRRFDLVELETNHWRVCANKPTSLFHRYDDADKNAWCSIGLIPSPHLVIFGGGIDAQPLAKIAHDIGYDVSVFDQRIGNAAKENFPYAACFHQELSTLDQNLGLRKADAVVIMQHNLSLDAQALKLAKIVQPQYLGILGPAHRRQRVEELAGVSEKDFNGVYKGPTGLDIGGHLPETIALSICAEIHQCLEGNAQTQLLDAFQAETTQSHRST